jgi:hypothetical protein
MEWLNGGGLALLTKLNDDITAAGNATTQDELKQKCQMILDDVKAMKKLPLFPDNEASAYLTAYLSAEEDAMVTCLKGDYASATEYQDEAASHLFNFKARLEALR